MDGIDLTILIINVLIVLSHAAMFVYEKWFKHNIQYISADLNGLIINEVVGTHSAFCGGYNNTAQGYGAIIYGSKYTAQAFSDISNTKL